MGMSFNLSGVSGSAIQRLRPWGIYEVTFKGIEPIKGKSKEGKDWQAIKLKFASDQGIFEPMLFCPGEGGDVRPSGKTGDREWTMPSPLESFMYGIAHVGEKLGKEDMWKKMQGVAYTLPEDFDKIVKNLTQVISGSVNKTTSIKLVGDSRGYAAIPQYVGLSKDGSAFISNNWLGDNLAFSTYEVNQMNKQKNAKPSKVDETTEKEVDSSEGNDDLNYDL